MIYKHKNKILIGVMIVLTLCVSSVFAGLMFSSKSNKTQTPVFAATQNAEEVTTNSSMLLSVTDTPNKVSSVGASVNAIDWPSGSTVTGGTEFKVDANCNLVLSGSMETTYNPSVDDGYKLIGYIVQVRESSTGDWKDYNQSADGDNTFGPGETIGTTEDIFKNMGIIYYQDAQIKIEADTEEIEYQIRLYYSYDGKTYEERDVTFTLSRSDNFPNIDPKGTANAFGYWTLKVGVATAVGGSNVQESFYDQHSYIIDAQKATSGVKYRVEFSVDGQAIKVGTDTFYKVTSLKGWIKGTDRLLDVYTGTNTEGGNFQPLVRAAWGYKYNFKINKDYETGDVYGGRNAENRLAGVKLLSGNAADSIEIEVANDTGNQYSANEFALNTGVAFYNKDKAVKYKNNGYIIYKYGYEITKWYGRFTFNGSTYTLGYDGDVWKFGEFIEIFSDSNNATFGSLAAYLDGIFIGGYDGREIVLAPEWEAVNISVKSYGTEIASTFEYNEDYQISDGVNSSVGQMVYYYETSTGKIIAKGHNNEQIKWNYTSLVQGEDVSYDSGSETYTVAVTPVWADNIYKINLDGDRLWQQKSGSNYTYKLSDTCDYEFVDYGLPKAEYNILYSDIGLEEENKHKSYTYTDYPFVERYTEKLSETLSAYNDKITAGLLSMQKKVFGTSSTGKTATTTNGNSAFYIYLANNQPIGKLPVFEREYYDLILWQTKTLNAEEFAYKTDKFNPDFHNSALDNYKTTRGDSTTTNTWQYADMAKSDNSGYEFKLEAYYFRKSFELEFNTINTLSNQKERRGYIYVEITDVIDAGAKSGKFIVVYYDDGMKIYDCTTLAATNGATAVDNDGRVKNGHILLFAGCDITVIVSTVDNNCLNNDFADMVGYTLTKITNAHSAGIGDLFEGTISAEGKVSETLSASGTDYDYPNATVLTLNAYFDPIEYTVNVKISNRYGGIVKSGANATSTSKDNFNLTGTVDELKDKLAAEIEYSANAGYTLRFNAFTTTNKAGVSKLLQDFEISTEGKQSQIYDLDLTGTWLLNYFYTNTYDANIRQDLKTLNVNIETFAFDYIVNVVDKETGTTVKQSTRAGAVQLNGLTTAANIVKLNVGGNVYEVISKKLVSHDFTTIIANGTEVYIIEAGGVKYAILSSCLSQIFSSSNHKFDYDFLLTASGITTNGTALTQSQMNSIFGTGDIVPTADRKLHIQIDVSKLYTIKMVASAHTKPDTCNTTRSTTLKNYVSSNGNYSNSATLETIGNDFTKQVIIYAYNGVRNQLSSSFDTKKYSGVKYYLGESAQALTSNTFKLDETMVDSNGQAVLKIVYIPKPITVFNVTYNCVGTKNWNEVIEEIDRPGAIELYNLQKCYYTFKIKDDEYMVTATLNGEQISPTVDGENNVITCIADNKVYESGGFYLVLDIKEVDKQSVKFKYVLQDGSKAVVGDDFGIFDIYVSGVKVVNTNITVDAGGYSCVRVAESRSVELNIKLNTGYHFVKILKSNAAMTLETSANGYLITNRFAFGSHVYDIIIEKDTVELELVANGDYKDKYVMSAVGLTTSKNADGNLELDAYIGKTINFTYVDEEREVLNKYFFRYYIGSLEFEEEIAKVDDGNGSYTINLDIDGELLGKLNNEVNNIHTLKIYIDKTYKYNLKYTTVNAQNAEELKVTLDAGKTQDYISGTNVLSGTSVYINITTKDGTGTEAKYSIVISGDVKETSVTGTYLTTIVLSADKQITIKIEEKTFTNNCSEYIYNNLTDLGNFDPAPLTTPISGYTQPTTTKYNSLTTVSFNRMDSTGELFAIVLEQINASDSTVSNLRVYLKDGAIVSIYDDVEGKEYVADIANLKHLSQGDSGVVDVDYLNQKLQEFGYTYTINAATERISISYVVLNKLEMSLEYLSYKTISQMD